MKNITFISATLLSFFLITSTSTAKNEVNAETTFGVYKIGMSNQAHAVTKSEGNTYTIYYEEFDAPLTVSVFEKNNCKNYIVRANNFEIQYTCNGSYFGIKYVDEAYATIPLAKMKAKIDRTNFLYQRCITKNIRSEKEFVRLIACFLPEVMVLS